MNNNTIDVSLHENATIGQLSNEVSAHLKLNRENLKVRFYGDARHAAIYHRRFDN